MGPSNLETLRGEAITLEKVAQPESGVMLQIRLIDLEGKEYCLPKPRCQTWFVSSLSMLLGFRNWLMHYYYYYRSLLQCLPAR